MPSSCTIPITLALELAWAPGKRVLRGCPWRSQQCLDGWVPGKLGAVGDRAELGAPWGRELNGCSGNRSRVFSKNSPLIPQPPAGYPPEKPQMIDMSNPVTPAVFILGTPANLAKAWAAEIRLFCVSLWWLAGPWIAF